MIACIALLCATSLLSAGGHHHDKKSKTSKQGVFSKNQSVGNFAIIGSYDNKAFILDDGASFAFRIEHKSQDKTKHWAMGDVLRQTMVGTDGLYELTNITTGHSAMAKSIPLDHFKYDEREIGTFRITNIVDARLTLADQKEYACLIPQINQNKWRANDVVRVIKEKKASNQFILENLLTGAKVEAAIVPRD